MNEPAKASPDYDKLVDHHGLGMLKGGGDLSIVNGDLALTKDGDLMLGDVPHNALYRLVEHWRHNAPHLEFLHSLVGKMFEQYAEAVARLDHAAEANYDHIAKSGRIIHSPDFMRDWHAHWGEQGAAEYGHETYAGCVVLLTSAALTRLKDDLDASDTDWWHSGPQFGGCSVGQIVVAAANGFRHEDEWVKARVPTKRQKASQDVLMAALGPRKPGRDQPPGRCPEVLVLLAREGGFDGLTGTVLAFAHEMALRCRKALRAEGAAAQPAAKKHV